MSISLIPRTIRTSSANAFVVQDSTSDTLSVNTSTDVVSVTGSLLINGVAPLTSLTSTPTFASVSFSDANSNAALTIYRYIQAGTFAEDNAGFNFFTDAGSIIFDKLRLDLLQEIHWLQKSGTVSTTSSELICEGIISAGFINPVGNDHYFKVLVSIDGVLTDCQAKITTTTGDFVIYNGLSLSAVFTAGSVLIIYAGSTSYC
jgi:hypothetical protein